MDARRKAALFAAVAGVAYASSAPIIADRSARHVFIVLPFVFGGPFCSLPANYAGVSGQNR